MWKIPLLLPYIIIKLSTRFDAINFTVISDAILDLKTMISTVNVASECVTHRHIASIIILVLLHFLSLANGKIFKIAAKLVILVAILYSILDF